MNMLLKKDGSIDRRSLRTWTPVEDRFWEHVAPMMDDRGCWEWTGSLHLFGYGLLGSGNRAITSHRLSYQINVGDIPKGMHVLHSCDNRSCVNPAHLFLGVQQPKAPVKVRRAHDH